MSFKKGNKLGEARRGMHHSEEAKQKMRKAHKEMTGEKSNNWKGGISLDRNEYMRQIHKSIYHSVLKNINMDKINAVAWNYLGEI